ncbi:hypothetical protein RB195_020414 [Necator americanus]|uniref:Uncharacterized protein n=1 Tax=Necator americanus TaxID=51031 RepID=A0ABR1CIQ9_NECAM
MEVLLQILPHASKRRSGGPGRRAAMVARLRLGRFNHATKQADDESLGKSVARYGDADVEVDDRCNAKRESIQRHCTFHLRRRPDN